MASEIKSWNPKGRAIRRYRNSKKIEQLYSFLLQFEELGCQVINLQFDEKDLIMHAKDTNLILPHGVTKKEWHIAKQMADLYVSLKTLTPMQKYPSYKRILDFVLNGAILNLSNYGVSKFENCKKIWAADQKEIELKQTKINHKLQMKYGNGVTCEKCVFKADGGRFWCGNFIELCEHFSIDPDVLDSY